MLDDRPEEEAERAEWAAWITHRSPDHKQQLVQRYLWLVRASANRALRERNYGADLDRDELIQLGTVGLLEAIERFSTERGTEFAAFAKKRIHGAIVDGISASSELRAQSAAVHQLRAERARTLAQQSAGRDRLSRLIDVAVGLAIGIMLEDTAMFVGNDADPIHAYASNELSVLRDQFRRVVMDLSPRQREVIRYHYYFDMSFAEVADQLGLSRARISQLHSAALAEIRAKLTKLDLMDDLL